MTAPAIKVEGLWKEYTVGAAQRHHGTFYDLLAHSIKAPFNRLRKLGGQTEEAEQFWALRDVNFDVQPGEVVGVIGRNGAGKSTLLKILSRITAPTRGRIEVRGRLASLLEVGTGFHPELSGRENIFLNGSILGMSRSEVARKFDEIVAFAEVDKFIDTPVKRYSSGMYVRLAFAVAAHLDADVLLVDEVLSVGDSAFQKKSIGKMEGMASNGKTVVLVSHDLSAIRKLCTSAIMLNRGELIVQGWVNEVIDRYQRLQSGGQGEIDVLAFSGPLSSKIRIRELRIIQDGKRVDRIDPACAFVLQVHGEALGRMSALDMNIVLNRDGCVITACHDTPEPEPLEAGGFVSEYGFPKYTFRAGLYTVGVGAVSFPGDWFWGADVLTLDFYEGDGAHTANRSHGVIAIEYTGARARS